MGSTATFVVREGFEDFEGGGLAVGTETFDLGEALESGGGRVEVPDGGALAARLDEQPALRRLDAEEAAAELSPREQLEARAAGLGIDLDSIEGTGAGGKVVKADIEAAIAEAEGTGDGEGGDQ